ncbi:hypothetical protein [Myroides sp. N17-2]|uniref:hypothetical protein n=1 Tax=Myroides sp. N17-2 TaxID=2030799 RepID=UPI000EFBE339|nr:hypothetical protein [Myroides sp. N17-2]
MDLMKNKLIDFYLNGSFHVAFSALAMTQMTYYLCHIPFDYNVSIMVFAGTLASYNFIKFSSLWYRKKSELSPKFKGIFFISLIALAVATVTFFSISLKAQLTTIALGLLSILYAVPLGNNLPNLRNAAGIKVYVVCFSWAGVSLLIPAFNAGLDFSLDIFIKFVQRFLLCFIIMGVFEIVDLQFDSSKLRTLPQVWGERKTKIIVSLLLIPFYVIEFFKVGFQPIQAWNNLFIVLLTLVFIAYASPKRSKFFTLFWVESVPIIWWLIVVFQGNAFVLE